MALVCGSGHIIPAVQALARGQSINFKAPEAKVSIAFSALKSFSPQMLSDSYRIYLQVEINTNAGCCCCLFGFTLHIRALVVVPCGGPKKSPRTFI